MNIDFITISGSINKSINVEKDCLPHHPDNDEFVWIILKSSILIKPCTLGSITRTLLFVMDMKEFVVGFLSIVFSLNQ